VSPTGFVPVLECRSLGSTPIGDSLAICEFLAESHPELPLWPRDRQLRALARSAASQMHSGFPALRGTFSTNFIARYTGNIPVPAEARKEVQRMLALWGEARKATKERLLELGETDEGFLFGGFSIADAFFWPVLWVSGPGGRNVPLIYILIIDSDSELTTFLWILRVKMHLFGWRKCGMIPSSEDWLINTTSKQKTRIVSLHTTMISLRDKRTFTTASFLGSGPSQHLDEDSCPPFFNDHLKLNSPMFLI